MNDSENRFIYHQPRPIKGRFPKVKRKTFDGRSKRGRSRAYIWKRECPFFAEIRKDKYWTE